MRDLAKRGLWRWKRGLVSLGDGAWSLMVVLLGLGASCWQEAWPRTVIMTPMESSGTRIIIAKVAKGSGSVWNGE